MTESAPASEETDTRGRPPSPRECAFYGEDIEVLSPENDVELVDALAELSTLGAVAIPCGLGNHPYFGRAPRGTVRVLSLAHLNRVIQYEPDDFTISVGAGMPVSDLQGTLAENGQELAIDCPDINQRSIGGVVATAWLGPRSFAIGSLRNFIIGMKAMRSDGRIHHSGGMVVKNVAGYDTPKLFVGSLGSLGPILEINFKLRPRPAERAGALAHFDTADAAFRFATRLRREALQVETMTLFGGSAAGEVSERLDEKSSSASVVWSFSGNARAVRDNLREMEQLVADASAADLPGHVSALDRQAVESVFDLLGERQEPGTESAPSELLTFRVADLPTRIQALMRRLTVRAGSLEFGWTVDLPSGLAVLRARSSHEELERFLSAVRDEVRTESTAGGRLLYSSPILRRSAPYLLRPDANHGLAGRIQSVFDPSGIFQTDRLEASQK